MRVGLADNTFRQYTSGKKFDLAEAFAKRSGGKASNATMRTIAKAEKMEAQEMKPRIKAERDDDEGGNNEMVTIENTPECCAIAHWGHHHRMIYSTKWIMMSRLPTTTTEMVAMTLWRMRKTN